MSDGRMWFGNESYMTWVPSFAAGSTVALQNYTESIKFVNGGGARTRSAAGQMIYTLDFPARDATGYSPWGFENEGLDAFNRFASGYHGTGLLHLSDEMTHDMNVLPRAWATPGLIEHGWPNFGPGKPIFSSAGPSGANLPLRNATWLVPEGYEPSTRSSKYTVIPIPPDSYLAIGATGSRTGGAVLAVERYTRAGKYMGATDLNFLPQTGTQRTSHIVRGDSAAYVKLVIKSRTGTSGSITLNSVVAQVRKLQIIGELVYPSPLLFPSVNTWLVNGEAGTIHTYGDHIDGRGSTGLMFADDAIVEEYVMLDRHLKGLSTTLEEVGAWR